MKNFIWTDNLVKKFVRIYQYGSLMEDFKECKTFEQKIKKFKELNAK